MAIDQTKRLENLRKAREKKKERAEANARSGAKSPENRYLSMNPIRLSFTHRGGRVRPTRCWKFEDTDGWYAITFWKTGDIYTLWLNKTDWTRKEKPESAKTLREMVKEKPLPQVDLKKTPEPAPVSSAWSDDEPLLPEDPPPPPPEPEAPPKIYYSTEEVRKQGAPQVGLEQVTARAEAEFARQEAERKIQRIKHAEEIRRQKMMIDRGADVGFEP